MRPFTRFGPTDVCNRATVGASGHHVELLRTCVRSSSRCRRKRIGLGILFAFLPSVVLADEDLSAYWPNAGLVAVTSRPGANLLKNGSFEDGNEPWNFAEGSRIVDGDAADG